MGAAAGVGAAQLVTQNALAIGVCGLLLGVAFLWLVTRLYMAGVFITGMLAGAALSGFLLQLFGSSPFSPVLLLFALVWGVVAVVLQRWAVILATVAVGAAGCVVSAHFLRAGVFEWANLSTAEEVGCVVLCLLGAKRQIGSSQAD